MGMLHRGGGDPTTHPSSAPSTPAGGLPFHRATEEEAGTERVQPLRVVGSGQPGWCSGGRVMPPVSDVEQTSGGPWPPLQLVALDAERTGSERGLVLAGTLVTARI